MNDAQKRITRYVLNVLGSLLNNPGERLGFRWVGFTLQVCITRAANDRLRSAGVRMAVHRVGNYFARQIVGVPNVIVRIDRPLVRQQSDPGFLDSLLQPDSID